MSRVRGPRPQRGCTKVPYYGLKEAKAANAHPGNWPGMVPYICKQCSKYERRAVYHLGHPDG